MKRFSSIIIILAAAGILAGCHPKPHLGYYFAPQAASMPGYGVQGAEAVFENKAIKVSARQLKKGESGEGFLSKLQDKDHILFVLSIENRSGAKVIYKPNFTHLTDGGMVYLNPLDYTDLYMYGDSDGLDAVRDKVYDLDKYIDPGKSSTGVLIFKTASKNLKDVWLELKEIYIGTDAVKLKLPFSAKPED